MRPSSNLISDNESRHVEFYSGELLYALWGKGAVVRQKMLIERIGAVSGYNSHKEIDFGSNWHYRLFLRILGIILLLLQSLSVFISEYILRSAVCFSDIDAPVAMLYV